MHSISALLGKGGANLNDELFLAVRELQSLYVLPIEGLGNTSPHASGTLSQEDRIVSAIEHKSDGSIFNHTGLLTVVGPAKASVSFTFKGVLNGDTANFTGIDFTFRTGTPVGPFEIKSYAGDNEGNARRFAEAINVFLGTLEGSLSTNEVLFKAEASGSVVTISAVNYGIDANFVSATSSNGLRITVSGASTLGGTDEGTVTPDNPIAVNSKLVITYFSKKWV